ncbi:cytochrome P450 [Infundibulicybe gibba]|nr:cytochrome P450 [Infundibulicybe gibba]
MHILIWFALATSIGHYIWRMMRRSSQLPLPPGPKGLPILGNFFDVPHEYQWLTYSQWGVTFGEIVYAEVLGNPMIILNSHKATTELFEKRSGNYADRPPMVMANELMGWGWDFAHMRYSDWWRRHRKTFHQYFQPRVVPAYQPIQIEATNTLLKHLLETPQSFADHVRQHAGSIVLRIVYGYDVKTQHDYYITLVNEAVRGLSLAVNVGSFLVDFLPSLRYIPAWFPGANFKSQAKIWSKSASALKEEPFITFKESMAEGTAVPSFVSHNMEKLRNSSSPEPGQEDIIKNCAGISYLAGSDTTVSVILTWLLAMAHYPAVLAQAQAELDRVVGNDRLPNFQDRASMPYMEAVLLESLRWNPVTPLALPHRAIHADMYEGYYIPKGTTVIGNAWGILHDENLYPEPFKFNPDRFLAKDKPPSPVDTGAFGFGRR